MVAGLLVRLAQAMAETGNMARSEYLFNEAEKIYKVVPGVHHPFYTEVRINFLYPLIFLLQLHNGEVH